MPRAKSGAGSKVGRTVGLTGLLFNLSHSTEWVRLGQSVAFRELGTPFWPQKDLKPEKGAQLRADGGSFLSRGHSRQPHPARSPSRQLCST